MTKPTNTNLNLKDAMVEAGSQEQVLWWRGWVTQCNIAYKNAWGRGDLKVGARLRRLTSLRVASTTPVNKQQKQSFSASKVVRSNNRFGEPIIIGGGHGSGVVDH